MVSNSMIIVVASILASVSGSPEMATPDMGDSFIIKSERLAMQVSPAGFLDDLEELDEEELLGAGSAGGSRCRGGRKDCHAAPREEPRLKEKSAPIGMRSAAKPEVAEFGFFPADRSYTILLFEFLVLLAFVAGFDHVRFWLWHSDEHAEVTSKPKKKTILAAPAQDSWGCTALHAAAMTSTTTLKTLLQGRADVFARDAWDETPLHFAARAGNVESCELLLASGSDVNAMNADDHTPLLIAGKAGNEAVCEMLLNHDGHAGGVADTDVPPLVSALLMARMFAKLIPAAQE